MEWTNPAPGDRRGVFFWYPGRVEKSSDQELLREFVSNRQTDFHSAAAGIKQEAMPTIQDGNIDFSRYTLRELEEALEGINQLDYPKNYANLCAAYALRASTRPVAPAVDAPPTTAEEIGNDEPQPQYDEHGRYIPNQISPSERTWNLVLSLALFAYCSYGLWVNDLYIPGKGSRGIHLHDVPACIMYGAMLCACLVMLSVIADHYDRRDNERHYRKVAKFGKFLGWSLFGLSLLLAVFK